MKPVGQTRQTHPRQDLLVLALGALALWPAMAQANSGAPMLLGITLHLVVLNLAIATLEAALLRLAFRLPMARSFGIMFAANALSTLAGQFGLPWLAHDPLAITVENAAAMLASMWVVAFTLSVGLEWPWIWLMMRLDHQPRRIRRSCLASLLAQILSYAVLVPWYLMLSRADLPLAFEPVPALAAALPTDLEVAYLDDASGDLVVRPLAGGAARTLREGPFEPPARLLVRAHSTGQAPSLVLLEGLRETLLLETLPGEPASGWGHRPLDWDVLEESHHALDARPESERARGLQAQIIRDFTASLVLWKPDAKGRAFRMETPVLDWHLGALVILPGDLLLLEIRDRHLMHPDSRSQLCLVDPEAMQIQLWALGRSPVVWRVSPAR